MQHISTSRTTEALMFSVVGGIRLEVNNKGALQKARGTAYMGKETFLLGNFAVYFAQRTFRIARLGK
jgi:hypothetical protein